MPNRPRWPARLAGPAVVALALLAVAVLAWRPIASPDIGYHLAYGETFLQTGRIVQTDEFTTFRQPPGAKTQLGPGCWYDADGVYHFPNLNWLSQVAMTLAHNAAGALGLNLLNLALVLGAMLIIAWTTRRTGVDWLWIAAGVLIIALAAYERFTMRPELFGNLFIVGQWTLMIRLRPGWVQTAGVTSLQILAVNTHTYFWLGAAVVAAFWLEAVLRWLWNRLMAPPTPRAKADPAAAAQPVCGPLTWALAGAVLATLANPWTWRGSLMPIQTIAFLREHGVTSLGNSAGNMHPWALITEFADPFAAGYAGHIVQYAYCVVLALAALGAVAAVARRRWALLGVLMGMALVSLQMRRNIALAAMILVPTALIALHEWWMAARPRVAGLANGKLARWGRAAGLGAAAGAAIWLTSQVVDNSFYRTESQLWRFGCGFDRRSLVMDAAEWLNAHNAPGGVFCDYVSSSNLMYFTRPHRNVPALTNTWASPPESMADVLRICATQQPLEPFCDKLGIGLVLLRADGETAPRLIRRLARDPNWRVVHLSPAHVLLARTTGPAADLAAREGLTEATLNLGEFIQAAATSDPLPEVPLHQAATLLNRLGWRDSAVAVWTECLRRRPDCLAAECDLAACLSMRGAARLERMVALLNEGKDDQAERARADGLHDWTRAKEMLQSLLARHPDYPGAADNLKLVNQQLADFQRGIISKFREQ